MAASLAPAAPSATDAALRRELYLFALYRVLEACLLALMVFSPAGALIGEPRDPALAATVAVAYLVASLVLLIIRRSGNGLLAQTLVGITIDVAAAGLVTHAMPMAAPGVAMMLLFNVGAASLLLPLRLGLTGAAMAAAVLTAEYIWSATSIDAFTRPVAEILMFTVSYFAMATLTNFLGIDLRASRTLADQRGAEAANLAEINELIIRRMRTGVLMVDGNGHVRLANEAALMLLGDAAQQHGEERRTLSRIAPQLAMRLAEWRRSGQADDTPMSFGAEDNEILPRFARLLATDDTTLVFLDDTSMVSRRAESLTLAAMGRFSASLAHEIRNPLAAISYATQLLEESPDIGESDRRLLQIVHQQCLRTNGIVESVLGLARRERAHPEHVELARFVRQFVDEYGETMQDDNGSVVAAGDTTARAALVDPRHLHQVLTVLVNNALNYGRLPGEAPRVKLFVGEHDGRPVIEVSDRGPGIPEGALAQLFRPFFTTSEHGTGLGLYIARELCRANEAGLDYVAVPGGGACFRVSLPATHALRAE
jgi:two-component system, NtrC family, sensor histidine kinase PilS